MRAQLGVAGGLGQEFVEGGEALHALPHLLRAAHDEVDALVERRVLGRPGAEVVRLRDGDLLEEREHELLLAAEVVPDAGLVDARLGRDRLQRQSLVAALDQDAPGRGEDLLRRGVEPARRHLLQESPSPRRLSRCRDIRDGSSLPVRVSRCYTHPVG